MGFPGGASDKEEGDPSFIPRLGKSPGEENGNPFQDSCFWKSHGQRSLVGYSPRGLKESDTTKQLNNKSTARGHSNLFQYSGLENPAERGARRVTVQRVTISKPWLKKLSTHSTANIRNRKSAVTTDVLLLEKHLPNRAICFLSMAPTYLWKHSSSLCPLMSFSWSVKPDSDSMACSMPGFPVLHYLSEFAQTHVPMRWQCYVIILSSSAPFSSYPQSFPVSGTFPMCWLFTSGVQSIGASTSVLPMNIQGWFPLGLTGLISMMLPLSLAQGII